MLLDLGVHELRLLTNNPAKVDAMREHGIRVVAVERLRIAPVAENAAYLRTKRDRMGHDLVIDSSEGAAPA